MFHPAHRIGPLRRSGGALSLPPRESCPQSTACGRIRPARNVHPNRATSTPAKDGLGLVLDLHRDRLFDLLHLLLDGLDDLLGLLLDLLGLLDRSLLHLLGLL